MLRETFTRPVEDIVNILLIPHGIYPLPEFPLQCVFEQHQAEALHKAGLKVTVLSGGVMTTRTLGQRVRFKHYDNLNGVPVIRAHRRAWLPARWESLQTAAERSYRRLRPLLVEHIQRQGKPEVIHAHNLATGGLLAYRVYKEFGIPYVVTEHSGTYSAKINALRRDAPHLIEATGNASVILAVSNQLAFNLRSVFDSVADRIIVVPNVVDSRMLDSEIANRLGNYRIAAIGNLSASKNYELLLNAFADVRFPQEVELVIAGIGPEMKKLQKLVVELGLEEQVTFSGHLSRAGIIDLLQKSHLFAHPSNNESFGVVLIEAMAMGLPILATDSGGPVDIVKPEVGILTPVGDLKQFSDALLEMFERRLDFRSEAIREYCRERFGPQPFVEKLIEIYERL